MQSIWYHNPVFMVVWKLSMENNNAATNMFMKLAQYYCCQNNSLLETLIILHKHMFFFIQVWPVFLEMWYARHSWDCSAGMPDYPEHTKEVRGKKQKKKKILNFEFWLTLLK